MKTEKQQKAPRVRFRQLAEVIHEDAETGQREELMGNTLDIDADGVWFEAEHGFRLGSEVLICFSVGERIVEARGVVAEFLPGEGDMIGMEIDFTDLSDGDRDFILDLCRHRAGRG